MFEPMTWIRATAADGKILFLNLALAQAIVPRESGTSLMFGGGETYDVSETPEQLFTQAGLKRVAQAVKVAEAAVGFFTPPRTEI
jgi:hypothetical protein